MDSEKRADDSGRLLGSKRVSGSLGRQPLLT